MTPLRLSMLDGSTLAIEDAGHAALNVWISTPTCSVKVFAHVASAGVRVTDPTGNSAAHLLHLTESISIALDGGTQAATLRTWLRDLRAPNTQPLRASA